MSLLIKSSTKTRSIAIYMDAKAIHYILYAAHTSVAVKPIDKLSVDKQTSYRYVPEIRYNCLEIILKSHEIVKRD